MDFSSGTAIVSDIPNSATRQQEDASTVKREGMSAQDIEAKSI